MKIKAGKYTLAVTFIAAGILMLANVINSEWTLSDFWIYSPIVFVLFGIEIITLTLFYSRKKGYSVYISLSSILLIIFMVVVLMVFSNDPLNRLKYIIFE